MEDSYREHSLQSRQDALDAEQTAYEETMTKFVDGLRTSLETATANMDEFLMGVTSMVMYNADTVLIKYQETNLPLTNELTNPWIKAKEAVGTYSGDALALMNKWTEEGGFFSQFNATGTKNLQSPWSAGSTAASAFKTSVSTVMEDVVSNISANVKTASGELSKLYQQIQDTEARAADAKVVVNPNPTPPPSPQPTPKPEVNLRALMKTSKEIIIGPKSFVDKNTETINGVKYYKDSNTGYYYKISDLNSNRKYDGGRTTGWAIPKGTWFYTVNPSVGVSSNRGTTLGSMGTRPNQLKQSMYAKGTTGTTHDEWAITDESWIGEEITLAAGKSGRLRGMMKGSAVLPSDISENLVEWGKLSPDDMNSGNAVNNYVSAPTNDVNVANSLTIDGKSSNAQAVHDSIRDTYELIEDTVRNIDSISQHYKPSVDEALTTPWVDAIEKANEFNAGASANYDDIVSHIDENKEFLEIALNTPYTNVTGDIDDFSQHAQKTAIDDVVMHANEQSSTLTTALSTGFNNAKIATDAFKTSGTSAVNAVKDAFTNTKTGLIKALNDTTAAAQKTKQAIDSVPTHSGDSGSSSASVKAGQHYISSLGKNVTLSSNVAKWSSVATQALQKTGQYSYDNLLLLLHQMQTESSGNQNAINNWDINAKNGTPSKGLMQVIDPTFQAYAMKGYDKDIYDPLSNIIAAIRYTTSRYGSLSKGWRGSGYANGTTGTSKDEWALTDEPQFGDELVLVPGKDGNLSFMRKGTGVVPADLTANLMEWGQFTPDSMNLGGGVNVNMINNAVNKPEFNFAFDALVKAENITEETLPAVKKLVTQELNRFTKELNYALKGKGAR